MCVAIRLDCGESEGLGHLTRCSVLADFLLAQKIGVFFICKKLVTEVSDWLDKYEVIYLTDSCGPSISEWSQNLDAELTLQAVAPIKELEWVFLDSYDLDFEWETRLRNSGYKVAVVDDFRNRRHNADVMISDAPKEFDPDLINPTGTPLLLTGPKYSLIKKVCSNELPRDNKREKHCIVIVYGASDPTNESVKAIKGVEKWMYMSENAGTTDVHVVVGPTNQFGSAVSNLAERYGFTVHNAPKGLSDLLLKADLVMTAGGNTMIEALSHGATCIVTLTDENQKHLSEHLFGLGLIKLLGYSSDVSETVVQFNLSEIFPHMDRYRRHLSKNNPFDDKGAERIYEQTILRYHNSETKNF